MNRLLNPRGIIKFRYFESFARGFPTTSSWNGGSSSSASAAPPNVPGTPHFTDKHIQGFCQLFKGMSSYRPEDNSISSKDVPGLIQKMNWRRTADQVQKYVEFWDTNFGGRMPMNLYCDILRAQHNKFELLRQYAISFDQNGDGFISATEFKFGVETLKVHDPCLKSVQYEEFVKQADKDKDGKVSIEELTDWLMEYSKVEK